ncbi:LexA family protein [Candidatus Skiveiella danica]|uniref:LexA family protein n=1 Tax=Candidatus Skiveiella danica TaxID=3386177 RepID=UPI0039B98E10
MPARSLPASRPQPPTMRTSVSTSTSTWSEIQSRPSSSRLKATACRVRRFSRATSWVVDRSVRARHGHIVVAFVNGERLVKRLHRRAGRVALVAENPGCLTLEIQEGMELEVWGVVVGKFKRLVA